VMTHRLAAERAARRGLFGHYRNPFSDDPSVAGLSRAVANTNIVAHNGVLLAMKEDAPPYSMDPQTLETRELYSWDGQMTATTFTAHPKIDPLTGELVGYAYAAKGEASDDLAVYSFDKHGNKALVIGRFVPFVRTYITVVAGVTRMDRGRFFTWSLVGAVGWVVSISLLGYFLGAAFPTLGENIDKAIILILAFSVLLPTTVAHSFAFMVWSRRTKKAPSARR